MNRRKSVGRALLLAWVLGFPVESLAQESGALPAANTPLEVLVAPGENDTKKQSDERVPLRPETPAPSGVRISRDAVREIPGALGDPARAVDVLPGQSWLVSGLPYAMVRGQPPDNTGYYFDGIRLPLVYHFGVGPGVFPASLVDHVDFYPGAAPANFGRAAGGSIVFEPSTSSREEKRLMARIYDAGGSVRSPFDGGRGMAWVGGRYAYSAAIASLFSNQYRGWYGDYHARAYYDLTDADRIGIFALGAYDDLSEETSGGVEPLATTQFHRLDLRYDRRLGKNSTVRVAVQVGHDRAGGIDDQYVTDGNRSARVEFAHRLSDSLLLWWGGDFRRDAISTEGSETADEDRRSFLVDRDDTTYGVYLSASFHPSDAFEANWGLRADGYQSGEVTDASLDPRASVRVGVHRDIHLVGAAGVAHQPPSVLFPLPGVRVANLPEGLQKTVQASAGVEADVTEAWAASLVGFHHWNRNTSDFFGTLSTPYFIPEVLTRTDGTTMGAELSVRGRIGSDIGAYLSYTLSRSSRTHDDRSFVSSFDRTHVGTAVATYEAGAAWRLGGRLSVVSGVLRNDPSTVGTDAEDDRVTPYFRLDGRAEKRWMWNGEIPVSLFFEVMNVTANREVILSDCEEAGCLKTKKLGPVVVPNIGAEMLF